MEKKTILERAKAIDDWVTPQRREYHAKRANDRTIDLEYGIHLNYLLQAAIFCLESFFKGMLVDPKGAIRNESDIEHIAMVDFLLPSMERWMDGEWTSQQMALKLHEYCKNRIMGGDLTNMNCTSPMVNLLSVYDYRNYCQIVKTIDKVPISFMKEQEDELRREEEGGLRKAMAAEKRRNKRKQTF